MGLLNFKNPPKMQFATFFQSEKSIFSVGLCAIHTMFHKLKIFKTVEMTYKYVMYLFLWMREVPTFTNKTQANALNVVSHVFVRHFYSFKDF